MNERGAGDEALRGYISDDAPPRRFSAVYANDAVALGYGAVARTPNEVAICAFGRTVRFHHHGGVGWRTFRRFLFTPTGMKVIRLLFSRAAPGSTAATPTDHGPA